MCSLSVTCAGFLRNNWASKKKKKLYINTAPLLRADCNETSEVMIRREINNHDLHNCKLNAWKDASCRQITRTRKCFFPVCYCHRHVASRSAPSFQICSTAAFILLLRAGFKPFSLPVPASDSYAIYINTLYMAAQEDAFQYFTTHETIHHFQVACTYDAFVYEILKLNSRTDVFV
jgi:hypothetical protein